MKGGYEPKLHASRDGKEVRLGSALSAVGFYLQNRRLRGDEIDIEWLRKY